MSYFDSDDGITPDPRESSTDAMDTPAPDTGGFRRFAQRPAVLRCYCPGDCACRPRFTGDYRSVNPPCGCRQHSTEVGSVSVSMLAAIVLAAVPVGLVVVFVASLAGALAGAG